MQSTFQQQLLWLKMGRINLDKKLDKYIIA